MCITSTPSPHLIGEKHPNHVIFHSVYIHVNLYVNIDMYIHYDGKGYHAVTVNLHGNIQHIP